MRLWISFKPSVYWALSDIIPTAERGATLLLPGWDRNPDSLLSHMCKKEDSCLLPVVSVDSWYAHNLCWHPDERYLIIPLGDGDSHDSIRLHLTPFQWLSGGVPSLLWGNGGSSVFPGVLTKTPYSALSNTIWKPLQYLITTSQEYKSRLSISPLLAWVEVIFSCGVFGWS